MYLLRSSLVLLLTKADIVIVYCIIFLIGFLIASRSAAKLGNLTNMNKNRYGNYVAFDIFWPPGT